MNLHPAPPRADVLGIGIDALDLQGVTRRVVDWADRGDPRYICFCNVHSLMTARRVPALADALREADLVLPDGAPVAWMLRRRGFHGQPRIPGPDVALEVAREASTKGLRVYLYGGTSETVRAFARSLAVHAPGIPIVGAYSPPFRRLSELEESEDWARIRESGAQIVFVGLGCPKQEQWMKRAKRSLPSTVIGVGAAFDFLSGRKRRAPAWMRRFALEWAYRLFQEPRRLAGRYVRTNAEFLVLAAWSELRRAGRSDRRRASRRR